MANRCQALLVVVVGLVGIGAPGGCAARPDQGREDAATVPSPTPSVDTDAFTARARAALMAPAVFRTFSGGAGEPLDDDFTWDTWAYCHRKVDADRGTHVTATREWRGDTWYLNEVHGYTTASGAEVVNEARGYAEECTEYDTNYLDPKNIVDRKTVVVHYSGGQAVEIAPHPGIEAGFGRCEHARFEDGRETVECTVFLARGDLVSLVRVNSEATMADAATHLTAVAAAAAAALSAG